MDRLEGSPGRGSASAELSCAGNADLSLLSGGFLGSCSLRGCFWAAARGGHVLRTVTVKRPWGVAFLQARAGEAWPAVEAFQPRLCRSSSAPRMSSRCAQAPWGRAGWCGAGAWCCRLGSVASSHGPVLLSHPIFSVRFVLVLLDVHPNSPHRCHGARPPVLGQVGPHLRTLGNAPSPFAHCQIPAQRPGATLPGGRGGW